jgi:uncharacterized phage protein (TIGR01671 family)
MKRTIKFKAWDPILKCWICEDDMPILGDGTAMVLEFGKTWVIFCQWTGLKDKNGKEIYEGDIVATGQGVLDDDIGQYVIQWMDGDTGFFLMTTPEYRWHCRLDQEEIDALDLKIIGNIFQNPEMVKP